MLFIFSYKKTDNYYLKRLLKAPCTHYSITNLFIFGLFRLKIIKNKKSNRKIFIEAIFFWFYLFEIKCIL